MAVIVKTIQPGSKSADVTEIQKSFLTLGAAIAPGELFTATADGILGATTQAAITALLARFGFSQGSQPPHYDTQVGRLLNIAVGAEAGHAAALRQAVRESFAVRGREPPAGPSELAVLARYAVIAIDFTTARQAIELIPDDSSAADTKVKIAAMVTRTGRRVAAPELLNAANYYTFRWDYAPASAIRRLVHGA
jgi:peptidoglycan hydrolase-like protein with peptidoglycan-binding domain